MSLLKEFIPKLILEGYVFILPLEDKSENQIALSKKEREIILEYIVTNRNELAIY